MRHLTFITLSILCACATMLQAQESFWTQIAPTEIGARETGVQMHASACGRIFTYVGAGPESESGWHFSDDHGATWNYMEALKTINVYDLITLNGQTLVAGTRNAIHHSDDCGDTWKAVIQHNDDDAWFAYINYEKFQQEPGGKILVNTFQQIASASEDGYAFGDESGSKWTGSVSPIPQDCKHETALKLVSAERLLCLSNLSEGEIRATHPDSRDWKVILRPNERGEGNWKAQAIEVARNQNILIGTDNADVPFVSSDDGGDSWNFPNVGAEQPRGTSTQGILADRFNNFFVAEGRNVWYTDDLAVSWQQLPEPIGGTEPILNMCLDSANYLYAIALNSAYRSSQPVYTVSDVHSSAPSTSGELRLSPNPTNGSFELHFSLGAADRISAEVYDLHGRQIMQVFERRFAAGSHSVPGSLAGAAPGLYVLKLSGTNGAQSKTISVVR